MGSQTWEPEHQFPQFKMWIAVLSEGSWYSNYITDLKRLINHKALYHYKGIYYKRWKSPCLYTEHARCPPITRFPLMIPVQSYFIVLSTFYHQSRLLLWAPECWSDCLTDLAPGISQRHPKLYNPTSKATPSEVFEQWGSHSSSSLPAADHPHWTHCSTRHTAPLPLPLPSSHLSWLTAKWNLLEAGVPRFPWA